MGLACRLASTAWLGCQISALVTCSQPQRSCIGWQDSQNGTEPVAADPSLLLGESLMKAQSSPSLQILRAGLLFLT